MIANPQTKDVSGKHADLHDLSDGDLVRLISKARNRKAYDVLVGRYLGKIWKLAFSVLKTEQDADDAVQDIFLKLWTAGISWAPEGENVPSLDQKEKIRASFATWIYKVSLNRCIDMRRKKFRRNEASEDQSPELSSAETAYKTVLQKQLSQSLSDVMKTLPEAQRKALFYYYYREMSVGDIAGEMQSTDQAVRSLLKRGKATLRGVMDSNPAYKNHMASIADILH